MKNNLLIFIIIVSVLVYIFFYLGIELDLKNVIERIGVKTNQLIDTSFNIRKFATIQLIIFLLLSTMCIYLIIKKK
jgi:uncharacterized membrane protein